MYIGVAHQQNMLLQFLRRSKKKDIPPSRTPFLSGELDSFTNLSEPITGVTVWTHNIPQPIPRGGAPRRQTDGAHLVDSWPAQKDPFSKLE